MSDFAALTTPKRPPRQSRADQSGCPCACQVSRKLSTAASTRGSSTSSMSAAAPNSQTRPSAGNSVNGTTGMGGSLGKNGVAV